MEPEQHPQNEPGAFLLKMQMPEHEAEVKTVMHTAGRMYASGYPDQKIIDKLSSLGVDARSARAILKDLSRPKTDPKDTKPETFLNPEDGGGEWFVSLMMGLTFGVIAFLVFNVCYFILNVAVGMFVKDTMATSVIFAYLIAGINLLLSRLMIETSYAGALGFLAGSLLGGLGWMYLFPGSPSYLIFLKG